MELWIRSQDKETLIVANHLDIYTVCFDGEVKTWNIEESGVNLGEYRTKERALEVLDEIQNHLLKMGDNEILTDKIGIMNGIKHYGIVYKMPKD